MNSARHTPYRPVLSLAAALLACCLHGVLHAAPALYDVEIIVFANNVNSDAGETWGTPPVQTDDDTGIFPEHAFTELSAGHYGLNNIRAALGRSGAYRVLLHRAWRQLAYDSGHARSYPLHSLSDNGRDSVEGRITLTRERYLHLDADLYLVKPGDSSARMRYSGAADNRAAFRLAERRRIRSNELHYFDHPRFGMIARVTPYVDPQAEAGAAAAGEQQDSTDGSAGGQDGATAEPPAADNEQLTR